jgi:ADP-ribose pyrophosphatase
MEIVNVEQLTHEKWLNLFAVSYRNGDKPGRWVFASRNPKPYESIRRAEAVVIVPILLAPDQPPRLVLIKEYRVPVGDYVYGFPAGLLEETGLEIVNFKRVTGPLLSSSGLTDETAALAFVDVRATPESKQQLEGLEEIEVVLLDFAGVGQMCANTGVHLDVRAWTVLYMYQQLGKLS